MKSENLDKQVADLTRLIDISRQIGVTIELDPLLKSIEEASLDVLDCERASVFLYDKQTDELFSTVATGVREIRFPADKGIAGEVAQTRKTINVPDAYQDPRFNPSVDKATGYKTRNILTLSMAGHDGQLMGVLQLLNKREASFSALDKGIAETLSSLAGVAIQRQLLLEEYAEKQKLERDLDLAREIQGDYLPTEDPQISGFDIAGWNKPAEQTGGDSFDFIPLSGDRLGLLIADATGHGVGPALMVAECRALIRALTLSTDNLSQVMSKANCVLVNDLKEGRFITACFAVLDPEQSSIEFLSAGHGPLIYFNASKDHFDELSACTLPMGILEDFQCDTTQKVCMSEGDFFVLITDGFFEWARPDGEQFGTERIFDIIRASRDKPCLEIIRILHHAVLEFGQGTPQLDDLTVVLVKKTTG